MKKVIIFFILFISHLSLAEVLNGIDNIDDGIKSFLEPLKQGPASLNKAFKVVTGLNNDSNRYVEEFMAKRDPNYVKKPDPKEIIKNIMINEQQGALQDYQEVHSENILTGLYVVKTYQLNFKGGKSIKVEFYFIQPTKENKYVFSDLKVL